MCSYSLDTLLRRADAHYAPHSIAPRIGLTTNYLSPTATLCDRYYQQVLAAGGVPLLLPPTDDEGVLLAYIDQLDGLLLTGGGDCDPQWVGETPTEYITGVCAVRDAMELTLARLAYRRQLPLLGICRGMQMMVLALGGHVSQDISLDCRRHNDRDVAHSQPQARDIATHTVTLAAGSTLFGIFHQATLAVNTFHHQTADRLPEVLRATAEAEDGVIEAVESAAQKAFLGVQWHPEWLGSSGAPLFAWLIDEARVYHSAAALHERIISLDSHCDTPMLFPQGAAFTRRDERLKVDLYKMTDGRLDATTMAAYVPQPTGAQTWQSVMPIPTASPYHYVNHLFDSIESMASASPLPVAIARNAEDVRENKRLRRKSIILAIENALAVGDDLSRVALFRQRGVAYITLCHNGDNQVCDAAVSSATTWHGLSPFGEQLVAAMNAAGVMVDLSHAAEKTFYDTLALSTRPVICSHASCKALCPHARNLSDDQLRQLAAHDGVCQLTLYGPFVRHDGTADISDFIRHIVHAAHVMGVEHIGIGSDFDGGGGITGLSDASEMLSVTIQLLKRHFSDSDLRLLWGENFLRVWSNNTAHATL